MIWVGVFSPFCIPEETSISGNGFVTFYRRQTKLSMNNDSDHVRLVRPDGVIQSDVSYISTKEKHSYNRTDTGIYEQSSTISPNATNIFTAVSSPAPKPSDDDEEDKKESVAYDFSEKIIINELLPNPIGEDAEAEFIEIKSQDTKTINLFGWTLDDEEGGSKPYHFTEKDILIPGKILVLFRSKTKLALNNDTDSVRLLDPNRKIISSIQYKQKFSEGQSYSSTPEKTFVWSDTPTPGKENTIYIQEKISPTPKQKAVKKAATPKKTSIPVQQNPPRVLAAITSPSMLPWPEASHKEGVVTRSVIDTRPFRAKQGIFVAFGVTVAGMQLVSGISHKERIWQK